MNTVPNKLKLRLFIDSADVNDWRRLMPTGLFYGITTNPGLTHRIGMEYTLKNLKDLAAAAFELDSAEIHLQVWGTDTITMLSTGRQLAAIDERVAVKVPITREGILCARQLIMEGVRVTLTAVHDSSQILAAIALGAAYAAPYVGRMTDAGLNGVGEAVAMQQMVRQLKSPTRVLVASIRQVSDMVALARSGLDTFTLQPQIIDAWLENELTRNAAAEFESKIQAS